MREHPARDLLLRMQRSKEFGLAFPALRGGRRFQAGNLVGSSAALFLAAFADADDRPLLVAAASAGEARALAEDLNWFLPARPARFLPGADEAGFLEGAERSGFGERIGLAEALHRGDRGLLVVASIAALLDSVADPEAGPADRLTLAVGETCERDALAARLAERGFERRPLVERPGQFAVRGGIVDVHDHVNARPVRIEVFGDAIDAIRLFDPVSQISERALQSVDLSLALPIDADGDGRVDGPSAIERLAADVLLILRDPEEIEVAARRHLERITLTGGIPHDERVAGIAERSLASLSRLPARPAEVRVDFDIGTVEARGSALAAAIDTLDALSREGREVRLFFANEAERHRFREAVGEEIGVVEAAELFGRRIIEAENGAAAGFVWRDQGLVLVAHRELFDLSMPRRRATPRPAAQSRAIDDFVDLQEGDYVVHVAHGIGRFRKIETLEQKGETQEFLVVEFQDEVVVYVPVSKADLIQKYIGGKGEAPRLSKLGGRTWARKKEEVMRAVTDLAVELLETQAARERHEGTAYPPDSPWQHDFEGAFPFQETADQLTAIEAIRQDMEAPRPMDRLLCGDVGYGKTEVAMRAAFKAVMAGRQVAVLVPTTVLAEQHLISFRQRMADWPVTVAGLSRFRSHAEIRETLVALVEGSVDIVIGTHRLLSEDVQFKDLGLVVIDEEQRFGVAHKERLRRLRRTVDVLTLTATPIPRTLHLSLLGIRDISSLTQPPQGRQPVDTRIVRFDKDLVRAAILRELERGGQCFFVHNRVQSIERVRKELQGIAPEARILVLHGQMREEQIEDNLMSFLRREADVLLATTIIESGLDVPAANTIFIDRPEMYGLADLHQLRGRVGREREKAHALLLLRDDVVLGDDAEKRLRAIEEFTDLGSGFRIAMRDLEIRGAGNLLGHEQHGHIAAVGYDLYCRLLEVAVKNLKRERAVLPGEVDLNLSFEAWLPTDWIPDAKVKLEVYRKLGRSRSDEDFDAVVVEMGDRFGPLPQAARDLVEVCRIRALAERVGLLRVSTSEGLGAILRPENMKSIRRRLLATATEHRIIDGRDVLLPDVEAIRDPRALSACLRKALLPQRRTDPAAAQRLGVGPQDMG